MGPWSEIVYCKRTRVLFGMVPMSLDGGCIYDVSNSAAGEIKNQLTLPSRLSVALLYMTESPVCFLSVTLCGGARLSPSNRGK